MKSLDKVCIAFIIATWLLVVVSSGLWKKNLIQSDVVSYYGYLPAALIYNDLSLNFTKANPTFFSDKYWPEKGPDNSRIIKTTMGLSLLYFPFFSAGHIIAKISGAPQDGFSTPYQASVLIGCLFYLFIGLWYLRKVLRQWFSENITALTITTIFFGTNLLWYSTFDGLMAHSFLFTLLTIYLHQIIKWAQRPSAKTAISAGLLIGLATLIRPTTGIWLLIPLLYFSFQGVLFIKKNVLFSFLFLICYLIPFIPQLLYWKFFSGQWLFYSYAGERFYFNHPHLTDILFSWRKGVLLYTPIVGFGVLGYVLLYRKTRPLFWSLIIPFAISYYVLSCWWSWWFGASYGYRALIDFYGILALPMAAFFEWVYSAKHRFLSIAFSILLFALISLQLFQSWQYGNDLIHYDFMTKEAYLINFGKTKNSLEWYEALVEPNNNRARKGLSEWYSEEEITKLSAKDKIYLQNSIGKYICSDPGLENTLTASRIEPKDWEAFAIEPHGKNTIAIRSYAFDKYVSVDPITNKLSATSDSIGNNEKFVITYLGKNKIILQTLNGKHISNDLNEPFTLTAISGALSNRTTYRISIVE